MTRQKYAYPFGHKQMTIDVDTFNLARIEHVKRETGRSASYIVNAAIELLYSGDLPINYTLDRPFSAGGKFKPIPVEEIPVFKTIVKGRDIVFEEAAPGRSCGGHSFG